jgi:hypothetical protein
MSEHRFMTKRAWLALIDALADRGLRIEAVEHAGVRAEVVPADEPAKGSGYVGKWKRADAAARRPPGRPKAA